MKLKVCSASRFKYEIESMLSSMKLKVCSKSRLRYEIESMFCVQIQV